MDDQGELEPLPSLKRRDDGMRFLAFEVTVKPVAGRWQPFVVLRDFHGAHSYPNRFDAFALPSMPTRAHAEDLACLVVWEYLDDLERWDQEQGEFVKISPLE